MKANRSQLASIKAGAIVLSLLLAATGSSWGASPGYESGRALQASRLLPPELISGQDFQVDENVVNDGFFNHYQIRSAYGDESVVTTFLLKKRIHEIAAIGAMKQVGTADIAEGSVVDSGEKTVAGIASFLSSPMETLSGAEKGASNLFSRVDEDLTSDPAQADGSRMEQLIGFSKSKRDIAHKFGVDVYSENQALQKELNRLALADYAGGLAVSAVTSAVPGGAGSFLSLTGAARLLNEEISLTPPSELRRRNRQKLAAMGLDPDLVELFLNNPSFSPRRQTWLVTILEKLAGAGNQPLLLKVALQAQDSATALAITEMAAMYAAYHARIKTLERFYPVARVWYAKDSAGKIVAFLPADYLLWSRRLAGSLDQIRHEQQAKRFELWISGEYSAEARQELARAGWEVHDRFVPDRDGGEANQ